MGAPTAVLTRRCLLRTTAGLMAATLNPGQAFADDAAMAVAMNQALGGVVPKPGRVKIDITPLAENGNAVPITVEVESPMTAADHVKTIYLFSPENPLPDIARFHLTPRAGRARVLTTIRLATSQRVHAVAVMSDGSAWSESAEVVVTLSACLDAG